MRILDWPAGRTFTRAHPHVFGSSEFDRRPVGVADARFSPVEVGGELVPAIYGGVDDRTATAETVFHLLPTATGPAASAAVPARPGSGPLSIRSATCTWLRSTRPIRVQRRWLSETHRPTPRSVTPPHGSWSPSPIDGLVWASQQLHDRPSTVTLDLDSTDISIVLFGPTAGRAGGVLRDDLHSTDPAVPFVSAAGWMRLMRVGTELDVTVLVA